MREQRSDRGVAAGSAAVQIPGESAARAGQTKWLQSAQEPG